MVKKNSFTKIAFTGNTKLTFKCIDSVKKNFDNLDVVAVFGLPNKQSKDKTNFYDLNKYCNHNNIKLFKTNNWDEFKIFCKENGIELIITIGDSRIIPESIVSSFRTIGNHGAILPNVQGGASLVWGRMLNSGVWGVSIMEIDKRVDAGDILKTKSFEYDSNWSELEFVEKCDNLTVDALVEVLSGDYTKKSNSKWDVKVNKHTDSCVAIDILRYCLSKNLNVYMPPRTLLDAKIKRYWPVEFTEIFKVAQDKPYPKSIPLAL